MRLDSEVTAVSITWSLSPWSLKKFYRCVKEDNPDLRMLSIVSEESGYLFTLIGEEKGIRIEAEELIAKELAQPQGRRGLRIIWK